MERTRVYRDGALEAEDFDPSELSDYLDQPGTVVWLDLESPTAADLALIEEEFGLHPLAVEDSISVDHFQRPKLDVYEDHVFLVVHALAMQEDVTPSEVAMFVSERYLITVRKSPAWPMKAVLHRWDNARIGAGVDVGILLYEQLDQIVDGYFVVLDALEDRVEALEDRLFDGDKREVIQKEIFDLRKHLLTARKSIVPLREAINGLLRRETAFIDDAMRPYYLDTYDHVIRASDSIEVMRELLTSSLEVHLSLVSNRLNAIMKKVTSWAAILGAATTIAGIYGMNFKLVPHEQTIFGFWFAVGLIFVACSILYIYFKARDWL